MGKLYVMTISKRKDYSTIIIDDFEEFGQNEIKPTVIKNETLSSWLSGMNVDFEYMAEDTTHQFTFTEIERRELMLFCMNDLLEEH